MLILERLGGCTSRVSAAAHVASQRLHPSFEGAHVPDTSSRILACRWSSSTPSRRASPCSTRFSLARSHIRYVGRGRCESDGGGVAAAKKYKSNLGGLVGVTVRGASGGCSTWVVRVSWASSGPPCNSARRQEAHGTGGGVDDRSPGGRCGGV